MVMHSRCAFIHCVSIYFFFFKQKTAYEMRISDWSSDVCSSDLTSPPRFMDQILESDRGFEPYYQPASYHHLQRHGAGRHRLLRQDPGTTLRKADAVLRRPHSHLPSLFRGRDRKRGVSGKSLSVRVVLGRRRTIKKQKNQPP